jgi:hypothetical protein
LTPEGSAKVQLHPEASSAIVFGSRSLGVEVTIDEIRALHQYVGNAVFPRFEGVFKSGSNPETI